MSRLSIIGVTDCSQQSGLHAYHISGESSVHSAANKARRLPTMFSSTAVAETATSDILDAREAILFMASPSNIDLFLSQSLCRFSSRAHDSARAGCAQEMQRQRKGQVSSSFIVYARCRA
ncbi:MULTISPECIES: glutamine amidotransferase [Pseudomonas]|uniref:glutamine amidotransferase n=1 Tax=Pseudomonas TaxID=286 RepID=UPI001B320B9D|nr:MULTISPECIES: glutamine amidotransferase [Pseudomonas]MBP5944116.1 glutamine amidotransferase [Pseudomonas sp. P9(2020)]MBP5956258.1 glutamine amidotransferase [Pseudomonas anatoliensis]MBZ9562855.1 glutamine amidotransferase [Pseudomonas sp. P116]